ncbi:MAG: rhodanese-like domain-containing protein [Candidatus Hodarchaeales archaeon]|jgi:rhodanese-related sulfurtransferase
MYNKSIAFYLILLFGLLFSINYQMIASANTQENYLTISVSEAKELIQTEQDLFILDVRSESEYADGHIQGAYLIPHTEIYNRQDELPTNKSHPILVYCRSGTRSAAASSTLASLNYTTVYNMDGEFLDWVNAGYYSETAISSTTMNTLFLLQLNTHLHHPFLLRILHLPSN